MPKINLRLLCSTAISTSTSTSTSTTTTTTTGRYDRNVAVRRYGW
jgi:hypothetical protein